MSTILPRGIVINSPGISGDIERRDREPLTPAEIAKFWRVYTTTKRRLLDPTAERLENLWWRIWGSRKRSLEGAKVAKLFSEISDGQTFVPLRGPSNRYEASNLAKKSPDQIQESSSSAAIHNVTEADADSEADSSSRRVSPNASKNPAAVLPPPILKKSRGPSASGPRPTARFVSPLSSEDEAATNSNSNSTTSGNSHVVVRPPTPELVTSPPDTKVVASLSKRKIPAFAALNAGHKRRVGAARRRSSQSSTSSEASLRTRITGLKKEQWDGALPETPEEPVVLAKNPKASKLVETLSPSTERRNGVKAGKNIDIVKGSESVGKLAGKKIAHKQPVPKEPNSLAKDENVDFADSGPAGSQEAIESAQGARHKGNMFKDAKSSKYGLRDDPTPESSSRLPNPRWCQPQLDSNRSEIVTESSQVPHEGLSLISDEDHVPVRNLAALHHFAKTDGKSTISVAPTYAAATGQIDFNETLQPSANRDTKDNELDFELSNASNSDLFAKRPVQSLTKAASALFDSSGRASTETPMSRSKSQLTLLLEKDRAKSKPQKGTEGALSPKSPKSKESKLTNSELRKG